MLFLIPKHYLLSLNVALIMIILNNIPTAAVLSSYPEQLIYQVRNYGNEGENTVTLYDPKSGSQMPLFNDKEILFFQWSVDGRLAFTTTFENHTEFKIVDVFAIDTNIASIPHAVSEVLIPLSWSQDGHLLALNVATDEFIHYFSVSEGDVMRLWVWDGTKIIDITPEEPENIYVYTDLSWSKDGRLAFTVIYRGLYDTDGDHSEIYLWDGNKTMPLSQNPDGRDSDPTWSSNGRLAFLSQNSDEYDILLWDGISTQSGMPDATTFTNIAPLLTQEYSAPTWTNTDQLAFTAPAEAGNPTQVFMWDGENVVNISQNSAVFHTGMTWTTDGRWAFVGTLYDSIEKTIYVIDGESETLLTASQGETMGQFFPPIWSPSGKYLAFCTSHGSEWMLSLWDGTSTTPVAQGNEIAAQWQGGDKVACYWEI